MMEAFERRGIEITAGIDGVVRIEELVDGQRLVYERGGEDHALRVGAVIFAVGWPGNADQLGLDLARVEVGRGGYVQVDDTFRTSAPHVFAAGDLTGRTMLVQSATNEAEVAAENAVLGGNRTLRHAVVPHGASPTRSTAALALPNRRLGAPKIASSRSYPTRTSTAVLWTGVATGRAS